MRAVHKLHRLFGTALAVLIAVWFASGAVMSFTGYPRYRESERLAQAVPLPLTLSVQGRPAVAPWLQQDAVTLGSRARLSMILGSATWTWNDASGTRQHAAAAKGGGELAMLDAARARHEAEQRMGFPSMSVSELTRPDQWTVGQVAKAFYPLFRVQLADDAGSEVYVSARTGEIVQASTRSERFWCWLGAIPHWIYPTILRQERELWRSTVLVLAGLGLLLTLSGLTAGLHVLRVTSKRNRARTRNQPRVRNVYLRWHQRLGLAFGVFASTWLLSGALSLSPFHWSGSDPSDKALRALYGAPSVTPSAAQLTAALSSCQRAFAVRELELFTFAGVAHAACLGVADSRIVELTETEPVATRAATHATLLAAAQRLAGTQRFSVTEHEQPDDYYYATHDSDAFVTPYVRITIADADETAYYVDPARLRVVQHMTRSKRLERWLYHGLHSWDVAWLYTHPRLWQVVMLSAMTVGLLLAGFGFALPLVRLRHARHARHPHRARHARSKKP